ncbi:MAG: site-specific DNA-methyltransferase [Clostridiales bacterium]|nr:site-specific DNA-methyltransferase [Clostridiales bacterium]
MIELDTLYNRDCMEGMKEIPDGYFDIAVVDPPYGIGMDGQRESVDLRGGRRLYRKKHENYGWDKAIPGEDYFRELERVSREQIIFGANYFVEHLHKGTKGWIVWDKAQHGLTMSDCELVYTSFNVPTRVVVISRGELAREDTFHPTQKPVKLYQWILANYAMKGQKILDTHAGSGACLIACYRMECPYVGFEINETYWKKANERIAAEKAQIRMIDLLEGKANEA